MIPSRRHDPDALFNPFSNRQRFRIVIEASDAARQQAAKRLDSRSVSAAETYPHGSVADEHEAPMPQV